MYCLVIFVRFFAQQRDSRLFGRDSFGYSFSRSTFIKFLDLNDFSGFFIWHMKFGFIDSKIHGTQIFSLLSKNIQLYFYVFNTLERLSNRGIEEKMRLNKIVNPKCLTHLISPDLDVV